MSGINKRKADEADLDNASDWSKLRVVDLKAELEIRGLMTSGKKSELVDRLEQDDACDTRAEQGAFNAPQVASSSSATKVAKEPAKKAEKPAKVEKTGWAAKNATALKEECRDRDLSTGGTKTDLVERLEEDDAEKAIINDPNYVPIRDDRAIASGERRSYPFMPRPDNDFRERYRKAKKERMIMLGRSKGEDVNGVANETFDIAGSGGSMYQVTIGCMFKCDCPDFKFRQIRCKHVVYALINILRVPVEVASQRALLPCEIKDIFENAPVTQEINFVHAHPGIRKPIEGDCPICVFEFEEGDDLVWCKAACGQNFHRSCFDQWKQAKAGSYEQVRCVYCRTLWVEGGSNEGLEALKNSAPKIGWYKNIAHLDIYKNAPTASQD